ncbi:penicillin-binding protein 1A [Acidipila sp. EB88]|uniref:penicillin-binding protein 1A n=1 Tax=Acidipila sp. EB88 TaxID=2305226 RepID=UPI000F5FAF2B|nr:PBP1A family penicillin-binding protein [Acidipila sp. EB88]RRA48940.1 PBP1A family penicillin-binding protein [Acidipila sp. EB88]
MTPSVQSPRPATNRRSHEQQRRLRRAVLIMLCVLAALFGSLGGQVLIDSVDLPEVAELEHYKPSTITDLYDVHGERIGSFALERRIAVGYDDFAPILRDAVIAIEDKGFESHFGVNVFRVMGAAYHDLRSKGRAQGASTLTMQLARNLFLSDERTAGRKLQETLLSIQIERTFTKQQIFTMYGNQIYLGHGVYGFEAGAEFYFSKHARELALAEAALLAGLPKGPEEFSPTMHPERALRRRNQVLSALLADRRISAGEAEAAAAAPLGLHLQTPPNTEAPWFVETVRQQLERQLGVEIVHAAGLRVYTTLDMALQRTANRAVLDGLAAYERRQGWRGHLVNLRAEHADLESFRHPDWAVQPVDGAYVHALVTDVSAAGVHARIGSAIAALAAGDWQWTGFRGANEFLHVGDVIYLRLRSATGGVWQADLEEDTGAQGSLLAMDNVTGDVLAMVGGRDFALSQYNRAIDAERQVGSSFKPYVYTAAVEAGATPEQTILDAPTSFGSYTPRDYEGNTLGEITLEKAFADSRNIPAVKLAAAVGMPKVAATAHRFGVSSKIPEYLPIALGAVEITLKEQVAAYSVFPNDGMRVTPRLIRKVTDADGLPVGTATRGGDGGSAQSPAGVAAGSAAGGAIAVTTPRTARTMVRFLRAVTAPGGTAADASSLDHAVAGKTGTTSSYTDAWFLGFSPSITCGVWVGYDNRTPLGDGETGGRTALPLWMAFMRVVDAQHPGESFPAPLP